MSEFDLIDQYCRNLGAHHPETRLAVGDDAAVIQIPEGSDVVVSVDSMVEGVHFRPDTAPDDLAYKLLAVNLSDMAAMGALAKWATVALTMPAQNEDWLSAFSHALHLMAERHGVQLIGGDTTKGPLNLSLNIIGLCDKGKVLSRGGAALGDDVYVSGFVGDAALGLRCLNGEVAFNEQDQAPAVNALLRPQPQVALGRRLLGVASACLDVSDGLVGDLGHIAKQSKVSLTIELDRVPLSPVFRRYLSEGGDIELALTGGDDYQLAFTAQRSLRDQIATMQSDLGVRLSRIGRVIESVDCAVALTKQGQPHELVSQGGYQHF